MTPDRNERIKRLFVEALKLRPSKQEVWLRSECGNDQELFEEVWGLLQHAQRTGSIDFLDPPEVVESLIDELGREFVPTSLAPGNVIEDLELIELLGEGGFGTVYKAFDRTRDEEVAVKFMRLSRETTPKQVQAFVGEAAKAQSIAYEGIIPIYRTGEVDGMPFYVMKYIAPGRTLRDLIKEQKARLKNDLTETRKEGTGSEHTTGSWVAQSAKLIAKVAECLQVVHDGGLVHRDVKPENIVLDENGEPWLVDFGIAKDLTKASMSSQVMGTVAYMSPEQSMLIVHRIDQRTDIYSLGVVLYELLCLQTPFTGSPFQIHQKLQHENPPRPSSLNTAVGHDLELICFSALRKRPEKRYATAGEFAEDLRLFIEHEAPRFARPLSSWEKIQGWVHRHRAASMAIAAALVIAPLALWVGSHIARQNYIGGALGNITTELTSWDPASGGTADTASLQDWENRLAALEASGLDDDHSSEVARLQQDLADRATELSANLRARLEAFDAGRGNNPEGQVGRDLDHSLRQLIPLVSSDTRAELEIYINNRALPNVTLQTVPPRGTATIIRLRDPLELPDPTIPPITTSVEELKQYPLATGAYIIRVTTKDGLAGEIYTRLLHPAHQEVLPTLYLRTQEELMTGMAIIPASTMRTPEANEEGRAIIPHRLPREVAVPAFAIQTHEVACGSYRRFCLETGHPPPWVWPEDWRTNWNPDWDNLPAVAIGFFDAESYAAWTGCRLVTFVEWERAAHGSEFSPFPGRQNKPETLEELQKLTLVARGRPSSVKDWEDFLEFIDPVGSHKQDRSPEGVYDLYGSVQEWAVSSPMIIIEPAGPDEEAVWAPSPAQRYVKGNTYLMSDRSIHRRQPVDTWASGSMTGFRCGLTVHP